MIEACQHRSAPDLRHIHGARIAKTWRTPVQKAGEDEADYKWLHDIADSFLPDLRRAFLNLIDKLRGTVDEERLRTALEQGNVDSAMQVLGMDDALNTELGAAITKPIEDAFIQAGRETPIHTPQLRGAISYRFDIVNPEAVKFLQSYDFGLIRQVSDETRLAIRDVVLNAMQYGGNPKVQARTIRDLIGLTDRQTKAVENYRSALLEEERPDEQVDRMVARYSARMLKLRSETISRTETMRAANSGREAAWSQAQNKGLLPSTARRQWLVTPDDRTCFPARTPVMTLKGWKSISKVVPGDMVLTHEDRFRRVEAAAGRWYEGGMVKIEFGGRARIKASATYGHRLLTKRGWIDIDQITREDEVRILARPCVSCGELIPHGPGVRAANCPTCIRAASNKARWSRPGEREKRTEDNHRRWSDPAEREKARQAFITRNPASTSEGREKIRQAALKRFSDPAERERQAVHNRRNAQKPEHPFRAMTEERRHEVLAAAHKAKAKKSRGDSFLERKMRWFLEQQGIEFDPQWFFTYGDKPTRGYADFYLPGPRVVIECDGPMHLWPGAKERDEAKDAALLERGIQTIRFTDEQIRRDFATVANAVTAHCCFMWLKPKRITHRKVQRAQVYDIQVAEDHSFVAGGIVAHNCIWCAAIPALNPDGVPLGGMFTTPLGPIAYPPAHPMCRCVSVLL